MSKRENRTSVVCQEKKGNPLNNAGESELDVDDDRIELATAFTLRVHDATRNRSMIGMSRNEHDCAIDYD